MFLMIIEIAAGILFVGFIVTQVIIPGFTGLPLLPWFRRERKLSAKQAEAEEQVRLYQGEKKLDRTLAQARIRRLHPDEDENEEAK
jgi:hypothetical protein